MKNIKLMFTSLLMICFTLNSACAQDWANLNRFKKGNEVLGLPIPGEKRVVFMGNSITEGWAQDSAGIFLNKAYINRGISGQTTPQMLVRFRADVIDLQPKVVLILAGINDIAGNTGPSSIKMIMDNLKSMAELARAERIVVVLCSVLPALDFSWKPNMEPAGKVMELNRLIKNYAVEREMIYLDYFEAMVDEQNGLKTALTYDGVHPNLAGYRIMQPLAEAAIAKALARE